MISQSPQQSLFTQWYGDRKFFPLLLMKKACPLSFPEWMTYSYLAYRTAKGGARSIQEIGRATGLDRSKTIPKALSNLTERRLVSRIDLTANPPEEPGWFALRPTHDVTWYRQLRSFPVCWCPENLTPMQNVLYFCLFSSNVQIGRKIQSYQKKAGLAAMLHLSRDTVQRAWRVFETEGLVEYDYLRQPSEEFLSRFPERPKNTKKWLASEAIDWPFATMKDGPIMAKMIDDYSSLMLKERYNQKEILDYWDHVGECSQARDVIYRFMLEWDTVWRNAEEATNRNRKDGTYSGRNSSGMLRSLTEKAIEDVKAAKLIEGSS